MRSRSLLIYSSLFLLLVGGASLLSIWILNNHYVNGQALSQWSQIMVIGGSDSINLESFGLLSPHLPLYLLLPFYYLPGLSHPHAPYLLYSMVGCATLVIWFFHLGQRGYSKGMRVALVVLFATHPFFLWSVTSGSEKALSLLLFYMLCFSFVRMTHHGDVRAFISIALVMALSFFADSRAILLFISLLPLLAFIAPQRMMSTSPVSVYIMLYFPLVLAVSTWAYLNWIFYGDPLLFLRSSESLFLGAKFHVEESRWLQLAGGEFWQPLFTAAMFTILSYPAMIWLAMRAYHHSLLFRSMQVIFLLPIIAVVVTTHQEFLSHPAEMLFLFSTGMMAVIIMLPRLARRQQQVLLLLLVLGNGGAWQVFNWFPTQEMSDWKSAMFGHEVATLGDADQRLGEWLALYRDRTMIDTRAGTQVIVSRGDAHGLVLPFMDEFKINMLQRQPDVEQIVVMNPLHEDARYDSVGQHFSSLYDKGMPGYRLVYDQDYWRVYRRLRESNSADG